MANLQMIIIINNISDVLTKTLKISQLLTIQKIRTGNILFLNNNKWKRITRIIFYTQNQVKH